jgi:hypothetical protein
LSGRGYSTQVKKYGPDPSGKHRKSTERESSIPGNRSDARIYPVPPETGRNLAKPAAGYGHRIPDILRRVPTGNSAFPAGFSRKIHGILRQESLYWVVLERY